MARRLLLRQLIQRLIFAGGLVFLVSSASLWLAHLAPGDAASDLRRPGVSEETVERERERLGLDRPFIVQYGQWLSRLARFDLGHSTRYGRPVSDLLGERMRNTAVLASVALAVATLFGVWLGVTGGSRPASLLKPVIGGMSIVALSLPSLLSSLLLALLAARTGWFPVGGISSVASEQLGWMARMGDLAWHLTLPALAVAIPLAATIERLQSQAMTQTLELSFVRAAVPRSSTHFDWSTSSNGRLSRTDHSDSRSAGSPAGRLYRWPTRAPALCCFSVRTNSAGMCSHG